MLEKLHTPRSIGVKNRRAHDRGGCIMRCLAYLRVSTQRQVDAGNGLNAQRDQIRRYAEREGLTVVGEYVDEGVSGSKGLELRPELLNAIDELEKGDIIVVSKRDRIARDVVICALIEAAVSRRGARLVSAAGEGTEGDDPSSLLFRRLLDCFAEFERHVISHRTRAALQAKKKRGELVGSVPYGFKLAPDGVKLEPSTWERKIIRRAKQLRNADLSLRKVARQLFSEDMWTRNGREFQPSQVKLLLAAQV